MINRSLTFVLCMIIFLITPAIFSQSDIDKESLISQILSVDKIQRDSVQSVVFDAEYIEGEMKDGEFVEKVRFDKKIYVRYLPDTSFYHEEFLAYYKEGEKQEQNKLEDAAKERMEKKEKRKGRDISYSMLKPFTDEYDSLYSIVYNGIANDTIDGYVCHHFKVTANEESDELINGDFYFDSESFHLVHVDFSPAKLVKKTMFKLKEMNMSISYRPNDQNLWFPSQFDVSGKGKAMFFIGVKFAGTEYYRNPQENLMIDDKFEVLDGK